MHAVLLACHKWSHILKFKPFIVNTDSCALKYYQNYKPARAAEYRWLEELQDYEFQVKHRPGKFNTNAAMLSRRPYMQDKEVAGLVQQVHQLVEDGQHGQQEADVPEYGNQEVDVPEDGQQEVDVPEDSQQEADGQGLQADQSPVEMAALPAGLQFSWNRLIRDQRADPVLKRVKQWVHDKKQPLLEEIRGCSEEVHRYAQIYDQLRIDHGALCKVLPNDRNRKQLLVPNQAKEDVFAWVHHHPLAAHFGTAATVERTLQYFYWPGLL